MLRSTEPIRVVRVGHVGCRDTGSGKLALPRNRLPANRTREADEQPSKSLTEVRFS